MTEMMYCPHCGRNVDVSKWTSTRIIILIVLLILGIILGLIYLVYVITLNETCPVCKTPASMLQPPRFNDTSGASTGFNSGDRFCTACGTKNETSARFCSKCGADLEKQR